MDLRVSETHSIQSRSDSNRTGLEQWVHTEGSLHLVRRDSGLSTHHSCPSEETELDSESVPEIVPGEVLAERRVVKGGSELESARLDRARL